MTDIIIPIRQEATARVPTIPLDLGPQQTDFNRALIPINTATIGRTVKLRDLFTTSGTVNVLITPVTVTTTITETTLFSFKFNKDEFHPKMALRFTFSGVYSNTNGADTFSLKIKMTNTSATTYSTITSTAGAVTNADFSGLWGGTIYTVGSSGTIQPNLVGRINNVNKVAAAASTSTLDTTKDETFSLTCTWTANTAGNTLTIRQAWLEIIN